MNRIIQICTYINLGHPNVRAFITHGGLMGSTESVYCGVPVIVTPMFGDQVKSIFCLFGDIT